jgi:predicted nuclease of predicted toxin-antitoxin system
VRWLADECVAAPLVNSLRAAGHDVTYVAEVAASLGDTDVIALAMRENRVLLTEDKDFGDLVFSSPVLGARRRVDAHLPRQCRIEDGAADRSDQSIW